MMKIGKAIIIVGAIIIVMGVIFHLQGQSVVGPESSFMYSNPEWVVHGLHISIFGTIAIAIGAGLSIIKK